LIRFRATAFPTFRVTISPSRDGRGDAEPEAGEGDTRNTKCAQVTRRAPF
jgi:hypothetical protein